MATPRPIGTFCWSELATSDAKAGMAFYGQLFGWQQKDRDMGEMGVYHLLTLGDDDACGAYEMRGPMFEGMPPHWMHYVHVEDVDATAARVGELGGTVFMPPMDIPDVGRMTMFVDPTGARLAAFQFGPHCGATTDLATFGGWCWAELHTRDRAAALEFYRALFGWQAKESPDYTEWALPDGKQFAGMIEMDDRMGEAPPNWMGYVLVEDCDATFAKAKTLGATPFVPPMVIDDVGKFSVAADPQGAVFAWIQMDPRHG